MMNAVPKFGSHPPRVLIVENDEITRLGNVKLLKYWGYEPYCAEGDGAELLTDALYKARLHRCHLALVDLHLMDDYDDDDLSGLRLIEQLQPAKTIIVTASNDSALSTDSFKGGAIDFVSKSAGPLRLRQALDSSIGGLCSGCSSKKIMWPDDLSSRSVSQLLAGDAQGIVPEDQADEVLIQIFKQFQVIKVMSLEGTQTAATSTPIRPHSFVLQVRADNNQPVLVKLARESRIKREVDNYHAFVLGKLRGQYCPQLLGFYFHWDIGGAQYTFLGANGMRTFSSMYADCSIEAVVKTLRFFFGEVWESCYSSTRIPYKQSLFVSYCKLWANNWYKEQPTWENPRPGLPKPATWLHQRVGLDGGADTSYLPNMVAAVCHGDLHGDNLLVDNNGGPWAIDFERTGYGPILVDFVELEADILNRLSGFGDADQAAFEGLCRRIVSPASLMDELEIDPHADDRTRKALACAQCLRQLAASISESDDMRPYLWGLLFSTLFRAHLLQKMNAEPGQLDRTLYFASLLCERLDTLKTQEISATT